MMKYFAVFACIALSFFLFGCISEGSNLESNEKAGLDCTDFLEECKEFNSADFNGTTLISDESNFIDKPFTKEAFSEKKIREKIVIGKVSRFTLKNNSLSNEVILIENIPGSIQHTGGRIKFGPDGMLYVTTGDADSGSIAQDIGSLGGKILRINKDGSIPLDNPFVNSPVYSFGHRNPQGLAWDDTGRLFESEHGPNRFDEINFIESGKNYGWPIYHCDEKQSSGNEILFEKPVVCRKTWTMAPSGMVFVNDPESIWYGSLFVGALRGKHLARFNFEGNRNTLDEVFFADKEKIVINENFHKQFREFVIQGKKGEVMALIDIGIQTGIGRRIRTVTYHKGVLYLLGDFYGLLKITPKD